jgi:phage-related holin
LLLALVLFVAAMAFLQGKVEWSPMANILFVVVGFAGGLTAAKTSDG